METTSNIAAGNELVGGTDGLKSGAWMRNCPCSSCSAALRAAARLRRDRREPETQLVSSGIPFVGGNDLARVSLPALIGLLTFAQLLPLLVLLPASLLSQPVLTVP